MKISTITLNNYRAFYNEKGEENTKYRFELNGKSLLLYGENGSGKSSLYKGMKDFFRSSDDPTCRVIENVFSKQLELDEQPFLEAVFKEKKDEEKFRFSADVSQTNTGSELLRSVIRSRSFMTYRDLMRVHFIDSPQVNLFNFLFGTEGLLAELPNPVSSQPETDLRMSELWSIVSSRPDEMNVDDFCNGANQILTELKEPLNLLLKYFDESLSVNFSLLTKESITAGTPTIKMDVYYFGINLSGQQEQYHDFLNEARLSALSICIFLATHLTIPSASYEILFLDDIFTGLDTSNRLPLLDILTTKVIKGTVSDTFTGHQIILTTYDRQWYELAKNHLDDKQWTFHELYIDRHSEGFFQPALLPGDDDFKKADFYFRMKHFPACANYQRKICEGLIKRFLPEHKKYDAMPNGDIKPVDRLMSFIDRFKGYIKENKMDYAPFEELENCLKIVMNPMSHDDLESPVYRRELELVFDIIKELQKLKNTIVLHSGKKIVMEKADDQGVMKKYICELSTPLRKLEYGSDWRITKIEVLLLSEKADGGAKKKISYPGTIESVYDQMCHDLKVEKADNLLKDFTTTDGTSLYNLLGGV